jgi:pimeloyl-ACP methyl ester carboxylesterase
VRSRWWPRRCFGGRSPGRRGSRLGDRIWPRFARCKAGPVLLAGQSRGGFLAMHYAGLKPGEVMGVVNFSGGWYPYGPVTTPYYANAGRGAADKVPQLWLYADNGRLYDEALIHEYYQAFVTAGGHARFELPHGVPRDGHTFRVYPDRWQPIGDEFLATLDRRGR